MVQRVLETIGILTISSFIALFIGVIFAACKTSSACSRIEEREQAEMRAKELRILGERLDADDD
jgi:ABC-type amino acid transport system permease subunit